MSWRIYIVATWERRMLGGGQVGKINLMPFASLRRNRSVTSFALGIDTASDEYLAAYLRKCPATLPISLDRVMKSVRLLEQMGQARLGLRRTAIS